MRWVKIDGKGIWHYAKFSIDGPGRAVGETVCGKVGELYPAEVKGDGRTCKACAQFVNGG